MPRTIAAAVSSRSTSGKTTIGFLPPSSKVIDFTRPLAAAAAWIRSAVGVLPVNVIRRIEGWAAIAAPVAGPPTTTLITPSGTIPAVSSAIRSGLSGASSDGLMITQFPATSAVAIRAAANIAG